MASFTTNLRLEKPDVTDAMSPQPFNDNFDKIDTAIKSAALTANSAETKATELESTMNGIIKIQTLTQAQYNALGTGRPNKLYVIVG